MSISLIPASIQNDYEIHEWRHASTILQTDFPLEWAELVEVLENFELHSSEILTGGGGRSLISMRFDEPLYRKGWVETKFNTSIIVDGIQKDVPTHKVDCFKNRVAVEIEWNNKTEFYDRDLNNFRLLFDMDAISVGVIITRTTDLQQLFKSLGKGQSYGSSSTHMNKLVPRINGGGGGGCPILIFGIKDTKFVP